MSFFSPSAAWLALLVIPLVAFYFLKLKRPRHEVASLVLWRQVLNDQRVNSPFQRFKRNLLLLLQILLLLLLVLAAMQPFLRGNPKSGNRLPVLIDCSASMAALDKPGGQTRLDLAKKSVGERIDGLLPDEQMCLIAFGSTARQATPFTDNKSELRAALDSLSPDDVPGQIDDALRLAQAISRTVPFSEAVVVSDGNLPGEASVELPFTLRFQQVPAGGANIGITDFTARRSGDGAWEIFAQCEASTPDPGAAVARLWSDSPNPDGSHDAVLLGEDTLSIGPDGSARVAFLVPGDGISHLRLDLAPDAFDSLSSDNIAYLDLPVLRPVRAYIAPALTHYAHAVALLPDVTVDSAPAAGANYDLVITGDETDLVTLKAPVSLAVAVTPAQVTSLFESTTSDGNNVVDWRRDSPILRHLDFTEVLISGLPKLAPGVTEDDFESAGFRILAHGRLGPLILAEDRPESARYYLLFHTDRSALPYRVGFPVLCANLVSQAREFAGLAEIRARRTGILTPIPAPPDTRFTALPGNTTVTSGDSGSISAFPARHVGRYTFVAENASLSVGASLLSPAESRLSTVDQIRTREFKAAAESAAVKSDHPLWFPLALAALALLLFEWWFFHRRRCFAPAEMPALRS